MPLHRFTFDPQKGVIIPAFVMAGEKAAENDNKIKIGFGIVEQAQTSKKENLATEKVNCLIDTSAAITCISKRLVEKLQAESSGFIFMDTPAQQHMRVRAYFATLIIPIGKSLYDFESDQFAEYDNPSASHDILLGRDILMKGIFQMEWNKTALIGF